MVWTGVPNVSSCRPKSSGFPTATVVKAAGFKCSFATRSTSARVTASSAFWYCSMKSGGYP